MEKIVKFVVKSMLCVALFFLYFYLITQLHRRRIFEGFSLDDSKIIIWFFLFLSILSFGSFVLVILFWIKKKVKKPKTRKYIQIVIYGCYALWAFGIFSTRLHPYFFWNKDYHKTKTLVEMIHEELKTEKNFSVIYKENEKVLKHFGLIEVNTKSAGNFKSLTKQPPNNKLAELSELFNPTTTLQIYQKKDSDSAFGSMGEEIDGEVSIFISKGFIKCIFYTKKSTDEGGLNCIDRS